MEAADEIVRAHDIIKTTVAAEGYIATMIPRPRLARQSNGEHIHISLQSNDNQRTEESFLAGLLRWISAICAVTLTYILNHTAARPNGNLGTALRGVRKTEMLLSARSIQAIGKFDAPMQPQTCNLALASLLAAGLEGVETAKTTHVGRRINTQL